MVRSRGLGSSGGSRVVVGSGVLGFPVSGSRAQGLGYRVERHPNSCSTNSFGVLGFGVSSVVRFLKFNFSGFGVKEVGLRV